MSISAGGYVRSVAHELGAGSGLRCAFEQRCGGRRRESFTLDEAHTLEELEPLAGNVRRLGVLCVHPRTLLPEMPSVTGRCDSARAACETARRPICRSSRERRW